MTAYTAAQLGLITRREALQRIAKEFTEETGEHHTLAQADVIFDRLCDDFVQQYQSEGAAFAVTRNQLTAKYLAAVWTGDDRKALRAELAKLAGLEPETKTEVDAVSRQQRIIRTALELDTLKALRAAAKDLGITGAGKLKKEALVAALKELS